MKGIKLFTAAVAVCSLLTISGCTMNLGQVDPSLLGQWAVTVLGEETQVIIEFTEDEVIIPVGDLEDVLDQNIPLVDDEGNVRLSYGTDTNVTPNEINMQLGGGDPFFAAIINAIVGQDIASIRGIYELDGDELTLILSFGGAPRPADFEPDNVEQILINAVRPTQ